jgi:hypothetical protein
MIEIFGSKFSVDFKCKIPIELLKAIYLIPQMKVRICYISNFMFIYNCTNV